MELRNGLKAQQDYSPGQSEVKRNDTLGQQYLRLFHALNGHKNLNNKYISFALAERYLKNGS